MTLELRINKEIIQTEVPKMTLNEAREKYENDLVTVIGITETSGKMTNRDACNFIENEGIGYAVQHYIRHTEFKDPKTRQLWHDADISLRNLQAYVGCSEF